MGTPLENWVDDAAKLTRPDRIVYCDGSEAENQQILAEMLRDDASFKLNEKPIPTVTCTAAAPMMSPAPST